MDHDHDKIRHLLVTLLEALAGDGVPASDGAFQDKVLAAGLQEDDVHELLAWLEGQVLPGDRDGWSGDPAPDAPSAKAFRFFGPDDARYLTPAAMGYLVSLLNDRQIDRGELEALLTYASFVAYRPMDTFDLEPVIEQVLFRPGRPGMTGGASEGHENIH